MPRTALSAIYSPIRLSYSELDRSIGLLLISLSVFILLCFPEKGPSIGILPPIAVKRLSRDAVTSRGHFFGKQRIAANFRFAAALARRPYYLPKNQGREWAKPGQLKPIPIAKIGATLLPVFRFLDRSRQRTASRRSV